MIRNKNLEPDRPAGGLRIENTGLEFMFFLAFLLAFMSCTKTKSDTSAKFEQYYVHGEVLYKKNCSNCHQVSGTGLGLVYPPLNKSDFMEKNFDKVLCIMKYGVKGELTVNDKNFIQAMPGVQSLTDLDVAEIATYIYNSWEHKRGIVDVTEASNVLKNCTGQ